MSKTLAVLLVAALVLAPDSSAQTDPRQPVPIRRAPLPAYEPPPGEMGVQTPTRTSETPIRTLDNPLGQLAPEWQRFHGATRCEEFDGRLMCDNGYRQTSR